MLSVSEAQTLILAEARSFGTEKIALEKSFGRVLAENVMADRDYPPFNRSAMDGYAIVAEKFTAQKEYPVLGTIYAGDALASPRRKSEAVAVNGEGSVKIMTGAAVPAPYNAVIRREDARETDSERVAFAAADVKSWHNISRQGEDLGRGDKLPVAGHFIDPMAVTLLASLGVHRPLVHKLPRVTIITTGNEIVPVHKKPKPTQIRNANALALRCLLARFGILRVSEKHVADDRVKLRSA
ncbi:MAG: molybdopterin molybdenumtransferase MoeA, partial [Leptospiraceae bacterium]|nr:molybdopterin molybdenumtransferase MoeA [Leptospiraceae bacterium]